MCQLFLLNIMITCRDAMGNAIYTFRQFRESFTGVQLRGMQQDLSWDKAAEQYEQVLIDAKYQW
jgi:starch synthase